MRKTLGVVMLAMVVISSATAVLAQSNRDLTEPTGTEVNSIKNQRGYY
jgi:hypothetical protein